MPAPAARISDTHVKPGGGGPIVKGATSVMIEGLPAARLGDQATCCSGSDVIVEGETSVWIEHANAARVGDKHACGGAIAVGAVRTFIGETNDAPCLEDAAEEGAMLVVADTPDAPDE